MACVMILPLNEVESPVITTWVQALGSYFVVLGKGVSWVENQGFNKRRTSSVSVSTEHERNKVVLLIYLSKQHT